MGPVEALEQALERENQSIVLYRCFMEEYPQVSDIFKMLLEEELKHKLFIERKIAQMSRY